MRHLVGGQHAFFLNGVQVNLHEAVDVGRVARGQIYAQSVANEVDEHGILGDIGIFGKNGTGFRFFNVTFNTDDTVAVHLGKEGVQQGQCLQIHGLAGARVGKQMLEALHDEPEGVFGLARKEGADTTAQNDEQFCGLHQHAPVTVGHGVTTSNAGKNYDKTNKKIHAVFRLKGSGYTT